MEKPRPRLSKWLITELRVKPVVSCASFCNISFSVLLIKVSRRAGVSRAFQDLFYNFQGRKEQLEISLWLSNFWLVLSKPWDVGSFIYLLCLCFRKTLWDKNFLVSWRSWQGALWFVYCLVGLTEPFPASSSKLAFIPSQHSRNRHSCVYVTQWKPNINPIPLQCFILS